MTIEPVVEISPVRVVEIVPVRLLETVPALVVEIVPLLVVEIVPVLVVEMVPVFARAGAETARTNIAVQMAAFRFFMVCSYRSDIQLIGRLEVSACLAFFSRPTNTFVHNGPCQSTCQRKNLNCASP